MAAGSRRHRPWQVKPSVLFAAVFVLVGLYTSLNAILYVRVNELEKVLAWDVPKGHNPSSADLGGIGGRSGLSDPELRTTTATAPQNWNYTNWRASRYGGGSEGGRFPARGTEEFSRECGWTAAAPPKSFGDCAVLVRPKPNFNEGISLWVSTIMNGYIMARQSGCRFLLDYGPGVDVRRVMEPLTDAAIGKGEDEGLYDWTVAPEFDCKPEELCFREKIGSTEFYGHFQNNSFVDAPNYRFSMQYKQKAKKGAKCYFCLFDDDGDSLRRNLPGFRIETGFACAFTNLFQPAPTAAEFEPRLFTEILPALRNPNVLVVAIYARSGQTDETASYEEKKRKGENVTEPLKVYDFTKGASRNFRCAMSVEKQYLTGTADAVSRSDSYSAVVWMVLTDSPNIKEWAVREYSGAASLPEIKRTVLVTGSRGIHTRPNLNPSMSDFAEAMIDWYLLGESDLVVQNMLTFGVTGALRTARPIYHVGDGCKRRLLVHERPQ